MTPWNGPELLVRKRFTARPGAGTVELRIGSDAEVYPNGKQLGLDIPAPTEDLRRSANEDRYRRGGKPHDVHPRERLVAFAEPAAAAVRPPPGANGSPGACGARGLTQARQ